MKFVGKAIVEIGCVTYWCTSYIKKDFLAEAISTDIKLQDVV